MKLQEELLEKVAGTLNAKTIVLFGGSPIRRDEIIRLLAKDHDISIYGTLNEDEGMAKLRELRQRVDIVLIGGRYTEEQRQRISAWVAQNLPNAKLSRPGLDYPYENVAIRRDIVKKLKE